MLRRIQSFGIGLLALCSTADVLAYWQIVDIDNPETGVTLQVARQVNEAGYRVEIYRDAINAVRLRFTANNKHARLSQDFCPSFQVDNYQVFNRSINDAKCIRHPQWAEFVLGYISDGKIDSTALYRFQNGNQVSFRFILDNDSYEGAQFSLTGSSRVILRAIGEDIMIRKTRP